MGKVLGLDYGTKRVGVAVSDELRILARKIGIWKAPDFFKELEKFLQENEEVDAIVVGLPLNMSGADSAKTTEARKFAKEVEDKTGLPTTLIDERLSSVMASHISEPQKNNRSRHAEPIDDLAAELILQSFLDQPKPIV